MAEHLHYMGLQCGVGRAGRGVVPDRDVRMPQLLNGSLRVLLWYSTTMGVILRLSMCAWGCRVGLEGSAEEWCQTEVEMSEEGQPLRQYMAPITDRAIGQCMQLPGWQAAIDQQPWMHRVMNLFVRPGETPALSEPVVRWHAVCKYLDVTSRRQGELILPTGLKLREQSPCHSERVRSVP